MIITNNLEKELRRLVKIHDVIMISGGPGIGKSEITYKVAKDLGMKMLEVRVYEEGDVAIGLPLLKSEVTKFSKPWWVEELENNHYDILFFDDFHLVPNGIQKFLYRTLTDRHLHDYKIPVEKIILAGNFDISSAGGTYIQSPVMGRVECMLKYVPSIENFLSWANQEVERFDTRIIAFLESNQDLLFEEDPAPTSKYPSPRSWEHLSRNIKTTNSPKYAPGIVGSRAGARFQDFWEFLSKSISEILKSKPEDAKEKTVNAIILASEYTNLITTRREEKLQKRIVEYLFDYMEKDIIFLFCRYCYEKINTEFIDHIYDNEKKLHDIIVEMYMKFKK